MRKMVLLAILLLASVTLQALEWPPVKGKAFPDLELVDQDGKKIHLTDFKGKVVLVEVVGMTCPACNAWSGAQEHGGYKNIQHQANLPSIDKDFPRYSGVAWNDSRVVFVQILIFSLDMKTPSADDAYAWAKHFDFRTAQNEYIFAGKEEFLSPENYNASYAMIPGFYLLDKNFIVRSDATGHQPKDNLYNFLLPMIPKLFN